MKKNKGITLISLVIMIIILLILAGVTLKATLGENGLLKRAKTTVDLYQAESEREALDLLLVEMQMAGSEGNEKNRLGEKLLNKSIENQDDWHEVQTTDDKMWHGTGWYFLEKGQDFGFGILENSWLVNYDTGDIKELEEGKYHSVTIHDTLAVEDSLIINLDSAITDTGVTNDKSSIENRLGAGAVELNNFDYEKDGLINDKFVFDGDNDYITMDLQKLKAEDTEINGNWFENGFTFEFYGTFSKGVNRRYDSAHHGQTVTPDSNQPTGNVSGLFQFMMRDDNKTSSISRVLCFGADFPEGTAPRFFLGFVTPKR